MSIITSFDTTETLQDLATLGGAIYNASAQSIKAATSAVVASAKATQTFKDRTGGTRASIQGTASGLKGHVIAGGASRILEGGSVPHVIEAKRGGMLRFVQAGEVVFRRRVNHPGTKPTYFMTVARDEGEKTLDYGLTFLIDEAIQRI